MKNLYLQDATTPFLFRQITSALAELKRREKDTSARLKKMELATTALNYDLHMSAATNINLVARWTEAMARVAFLEEQLRRKG